MIGAVVPPVAPPSWDRVGGRADLLAATGCRALPIPLLPARHVGRALYGLATLDERGRAADRAVARALGWRAGTRLDMRERAGLILITADPRGVVRITGQGHLRLPAAIRRQCGLKPGDRVLLAADPGEGLLVAHPPAALDAMVAAFHAGALGGDPE